MNLRVLSEAEQGLHDPGPGAPDRPDRVELSLEALSAAGLTPEVVASREADLDELQRVHSLDHLRWLEELSASGGGRIDGDTSAGPHSFRVARKAAAMVADAAVRALDGERSLSLTRPPGHHSTRSQAMGFCLINHVAVAASAAREAGAEKVAVVDIDVHHGNGTQDIFYDDPSVLYISVHQWPWYPWQWGGVDETGSGQGEGFNVNLPLPAMSGDQLYLAVMHRLVRPVIERFSPDLIAVSAGFDAHADDPLSLMQVSTRGFGVMGAGLASLANSVCGGRIMAVLEGGYSRPALAASVVEFARALADVPPLFDAGELTQGLPLNDIAVRQLVERHGPVWGLT